MKKQLTALLLIFALLLTLTGCAAVGAARTLDHMEDRIDATLDIAENRLEAFLRRVLHGTPSPAPVQADPAPPAESLPQPSEPQRLTKEQAQQIALDYLGFTADQVNYLRAEYEIDDGIPQFDVELHRGDWEYEFEIHGETGRILSYDKDHRYD